MDCLLLKNAAVLQSGSFRTLDILIADGRIAEIGRGISAEGVKVCDFTGKYIFPGFTDVHVHFREPGFSYKETIRTGSLAAARSGYTTVCPMPNLNPVPDSVPHLEQQLAIIRADAAIRVIPYGAITVGQQGETLADLPGMAADVAAFSDDGKGVQSPEIMRQAMRTAKSLGKIIAAHCEDNSLLHGGYIHDGAYAAAHGHRGICSASEWKPIERDLALAAETGCAYHVCHVSAKESVALIRQAKQNGVNVTCETAPHYLVLTEDDLQEDGRFKMNPPLRTAADRDALLEGICDGTIDMIATDHAPHAAEEKSRGLEKSAMGIVGLETAFPILYTKLVRTGVLPLETLAHRMSIAPAERFGFACGIQKGMAADLAVFDLHTPYEIDPSRFVSMGKSTPFAGETVCGKCVMTVCGDSVVWEAAQ